MLVKHPKQPIGIPLHAVFGTNEILVEWEDTSLLPRRQTYDCSAFSDGTFTYVGGTSGTVNNTWSGTLGGGGTSTLPTGTSGGSGGTTGHVLSEYEDLILDNDDATCYHEWTTYYGLKEHFEYCKKCDIKR
jgi:hypothetical protein